MEYQTNVAKVDEALMFDPVFTPYKVANEVISKYRKQFKKHGVMFRAEGNDIQKTVLSDARFRKVLIMVYDIITEEVLRDIPYRKRFVQLKSMCVQQKLFLKFTYSSRRDHDLRNERYQEIQELLRDKAGYIGLDNGESENVIMIAIPVKKVESQ